MQTQRSNGTMSNKDLAKLLQDTIDKMQGDEGEESNGWAAKPHKPVNAPFLGVSVPIKVETPLGSARCYLSLPPEVASSPEALVGAIKQLLDMGIPIDIYQQKQDGGWTRGGNGNGNGSGNWRNNGGYGGGNGGYQNGNGYGNNGGGFRRGGW